MDKRSDRFGQLKDFEVIPPAELFNKICHTLNIEEEHSAEGDSLPEFSRLKNLSVEPPAFLSNSILQTVGELNTVKRLPEAEKQNANKGVLITGTLKGLTPRSWLTKPGMYRKFQGIAALFMLLVISYWLYRTLENSGRILSGKANGNPAKKELVIAKQSGKDSISAPNSSADSMESSVVKTDKSKAAPRKFRPPSYFKVLGTEFPILENDLLASFAGFSYNAVPPFLNSEDESVLRVQVDQFSTIYISKEMKLIMKKMYQYKSGGKLTRKARKTREKVNEWKEADEKYFDRSPGYNPIDPIDLGRFLFK